MLFFPDDLRPDLKLATVQAQGRLGRVTREFATG
jgi:hypothetical protein